MRVLWITNTVFPQPAAMLGLKESVSGGWTHDLAYMAASSGITLAVASLYGGGELREESIGGITYFLLPGSGRMLFYNRALEGLWKEVARRFKPDLVHLHGTEYTHGLAFLRALPEVPAVVSLQGIIGRIARVYSGGMTLPELLANRTLRENLRLNGTLEQMLLMKRSARYEREILRRVKYAHAVNTWDYSAAREINPGLRIFKYDFNLRPAFYEEEGWDIRKCVRYSILTGQCSTPLKGLHLLIRALGILKRSCPSVTLRVAGDIPDSGYKRYVLRLIKRLGLQGHVEFTGPRSTVQMAELMRSCYAAVIPSAIEGTSMLLREAAYLGVPTVCAFRGGMADFLQDGISGFLYDYPEYPYLAARLEELLYDDALALSFSRSAMKLARERHDREANFKSMTDMYGKIMSQSQNNEGQV